MGGWMGLQIKHTWRDPIFGGPLSLVQLNTTKTTVLDGDSTQLHHISNKPKKRERDHGLYFQNSRRNRADRLRFADPGTCSSLYSKTCSDWFLDRSLVQIYFTEIVDVRLNCNGFHVYNPNVHRGGICGLYFGQNMLQQRTIDKSLPDNTGYYSNSLLLVDVGNCVSCTDESINCSNSQRRVTCCSKEIKETCW